MKKLIVGTVLSMAMAAAFAGENVDKTLTVKPEGVVQIENVRGKIKVVGWDKSEVSVKGELDSETEKFIFETSGSTTTIKVKTPDNLNHGDGSDLVIQVPQGSRVRADLVSADLDLSGIHGGTDSKTVSGNITATDLHTRIELASVSGDIDIDKSNGDTSLSSVSGDIRGKVDTESVQSNTVSGDLHLESGKAVKSLEINTVSGNADVRADLSDNVRVKGTSVSGDIRLYVNKNINAVIDLSTAAGGDVVNGLSQHRPEHGMIGNESLEFTLGDGKGSIDLNTVSGRIELQPR